MRKDVSVSEFSSGYGALGLNRPQRHRPYAQKQNKTKKKHLQTNTLCQTRGHSVFPAHGVVRLLSILLQTSILGFFSGGGGIVCLFLQHDTREDGVSKKDRKKEEKEEKRSVVQRVRREEFMWTLEEIHHPNRLCRSAPSPSFPSPFFFFLITERKREAPTIAASSSHALGGIGNVQKEKGEKENAEERGCSHLQEKVEKEDDKEKWKEKDENLNLRVQKRT